MKIYARAFVFLTVLIAACAPAAFSQGTKLENVAAQAALVTEFDVNGLKVIVKRRPASATITAGLFIRGGSRNITEKNAGIESLMLNSAIEAGKQFNRQSVRRETASTGSSISVGINADYSALVLSSTRNSFPKMWDVFTDVSLNPAFSTEDVERVRKALLAGLQQADTDPDGALQALQDKVIYAGHLYANDPDGTVPTVTALTIDDLRKYHKETMQTSKLLLVVVGDIDASALKIMVAAKFANLPHGSYVDKQPPPLVFAKPTLDIVKRGLPTNYIQGVFAAPSLTNPDYYPMLVASNLLAERLFEEVRVKRNLSYAPNASLNSAAANTGFIYVTAVDANQAVSVMLAEINRLKTEPLTADDVAGMSGQYLTKYYLGQETNGAQVGDLAKYELIGGGWRKAFEFLSRIHEVKSEDIQAVSKKYMTNLRFVVIGDPAAINRSIFVPASVSIKPFERPRNAD